MSETPDRETQKQRYCEMCDRWVSARETECKDCGAPTIKAVK